MLNLAKWVTLLGELSYMVREELQLKIQGYASKGPCHVVQLKRYFLTADA